MVGNKGGYLMRKGREGAWDVLSKAIVLRVDEYFLDAWAASYTDLAVHNDTQLGSGDQFEQAYGLLALTNQRLLFIGPRGEYDRNNPFFQKPMDPLFLKASLGCFGASVKERFTIWESLDLEDIESFQLKKSRLVEGLTLSVRWWHRGHPHVLKFESLLTLNGFDEDKGWMIVAKKAVESEKVDRDDLKKTLSETLRNRWAEVAEDMSKRKGPIVVDFSALRDRFKQLGISLESIKCPSCGGVISLPVAGAKKTCEYCGSHIYAMQLMVRK